MSKVKSGTGGDGAAEVVETASTTEVAAINGGGAVAVATPMEVGQFDLGDDDSSGGAASPAAVVHVAHNLVEQEPEGTIKGSVWIARKTDTKWPCKIADLGKTFKFIPFAIRHFWREQIPFGTGTPRMFPTKAKAIEAGMRLEYNPDPAKGRNCGPMYLVWGLVEAPEGVKDEGLFYYSLGGKMYAPVAMYVDKKIGYETLKSSMSSASSIISAKFGVPVAKADLSTIVMSAHTEMHERQVNSQTRKIPYLVFDTSRNADGVVEFTSEQFREDMKRVVAAMNATAADVPDAE